MLTLVSPIEGGSLMDFECSLFNHVEDAVPKPIKTTWAALKKELTQFIETESKKSVKLWSPVRFRGNRAKNSVEAVYALIFDFDDSTEIILDSLRQKLVGREYVIHSSFSHMHTGKGFRFRLVLPLSRPATRQEWEATRDVVVKEFQIENLYDLKIHAASIFYLPSHLPGAQMFFELGEGKLLEVEVATKAEEKKKTAPSVSESGFSGKPGEHLNFLRRWGTSEASSSAKKWHSLLKEGKPLAEVGGRDNALQQLTWAIADRMTLDQLRNVDESIILDFATPSIVATPGKEDDRITLDQMRDKLRRARRDICATKFDNIESEEVYNKFIDAIFKHARPETPEERVQISLPPLKPEDVWTDEEKENLSNKYCSGQGLTLIVQFNRFYSLLQRTGGYTPWLVESAALVQARHALRGAGVETVKVNESGKVVSCNMTDLTEKYGCIAFELKGSFVGHSRFDRAGKTFTEVVNPLDETILPKYDAEIEEFLRIFCRRPEDFHYLNGWLSEFPKLLENNPVLHLFGPKHTGKTLIAACLARFWKRGMGVPADQLFGTFNDGLVKCPFVVADEGLEIKSSRKLRAVVTAKSHCCNRKGIPVIDIEGCIRVVVTTNDDGTMEFKEDTRDLTDNMIEATAIRILRVEANPDAEVFLLSKGGKDWTQTLVDGRFASHVLWLSENFDFGNNAFKEDGRFKTARQDTTIHDKLRIGEDGQPFCQMLHRLLTSPKGIEEKKIWDKYLFWKNEKNKAKLAVNVQAVTSRDLWDTTVVGDQRFKIPTNFDSAAILTRLSLKHSGFSYRHPVSKNATLKYKYFSLRLLRLWAESSGFPPEEFTEIVYASAKAALPDVDDLIVDWT